MHGMEYRQLGSLGLRVCRLPLGTTTFGGRAVPPGNWGITISYAGTDQYEPSQSTCAHGTG
jgi:aryl-alcohol dehydrogenase-like predicted oxidoreductase